jgi:hypothetical protein
VPSTTARRLPAQLGIERFLEVAERARDVQHLEPIDEPRVREPPGLSSREPARDVGVSGHDPQSADANSIDRPRPTAGFEVGMDPRFARPLRSSTAETLAIPQHIR